METAAATAPVAPAISTVLVSVVVAATRNIKPKMETVPTSIPKTMVPAEFLNELRSRSKIDPVFHPRAPLTELVRSKSMPSIEYPGRARHCRKEKPRPLCQAGPTRAGLSYCVSKFLESEYKPIIVKE